MSVRALLVALVVLAARAPALAAQGAPVPGIVALGAGADFTCALTGRGQVLCWGRNDLGQLGRGSSDTLAHPEPRRVALDVAATSLSVGYDHACVTASDGASYCWGDDRLLESGSATRPERCLEAAREVSCRTRPTRVEGESDLRFRVIAAGFRQSCGIAEDRRVYCWGDAFAGRQPADSQTLERCGPSATAYWCHPRPTLVPLYTSERTPTPRLLATFDTLALGAFRSCGVSQSAKLYCWGHGTSWPESYQGATPTQGNGVRAASIGFQHACGVRDDSIVVCWGERDLGALGLGDLTGRANGSTFVPSFAHGAPIATERRFSAVSVGGLHSCAVDALTAAAFCWGANQHGQLGVGVVDTTSGRALRGANAAPRHIASGARFTLIAAGVDHTCGVTEWGEVLCWGRSRGGATGATEGGRAQPRPRAVRFPSSPPA